MIVNIETSEAGVEAIDIAECLERAGYSVEVVTVNHVRRDADGARIHQASGTVASSSGSQS